MKVVFDSNVWNILNLDDAARLAVKQRVEGGTMVVLVPDTIYRELQRSPWQGVPAWFSTIKASDSVTVIGESRVGHTRIGDGNVFSTHRGASRQTRDAMIADYVAKDADLLVTEDRRARSRFIKLVDASRVSDFSHFRQNILGLSPESA